MRQTDLAVKLREATGKGVARKLRREGRIPAVFYGHKSESLSLSVNSKDLQVILNSETGSSTFLKLSIEGKKKDDKMALIKDLQTDPVTYNLVHADFCEILMDEPITVEVPIKLTGKPLGVEMGGTLQPIRRELEVKCLPKDLPDVIELDVSKLKVGDSIHIDDVTLSAGVEVPHDVNFTIAVVLGKKGEKAEEEIAEEGEEAAITAEEA